MTTGRNPTAAPRRAIVLGGGGVLGFAWMLGALAAWQDVLGADVRDVDVAVGTSAGSVAAALVGCRLPLEVVVRHHQGIPLPEDPAIDYDYEVATGEALPPRPSLRPASPGLVWGGLRHPRRISPIVTLTGLLPTGRGSLAAVHELIAGVAAGAGFGESWPTAPRPWIVAADYRSGRRIVFGRDTFGPRADGRDRRVRTATLADAVQASCSIPAWYPPTVIDGVPYIDGGAASNASLDVLRDADIDEAYVFAPMASLEPDRPQDRLARVERRVRRAITRRIVGDAAVLRAEGVRVHLVTPDATDLDVMGVNMMDPLRRSEVLESARVTATTQLTRQLGRSVRGGVATDRRRGGGLAVDEGE